MHFLPLLLLSLPNLALAQTYKATFTAYGAGDSFGSGNCNTNSAACGFFDNQGFNAAASENLFGVTAGQGRGPACGTCWQLSITGDEKGNPISGGKSIVVKVNNLCPAARNPLCAQQGLGGTNSMGANVNFDTCKDDGASLALFGKPEGGLATGTATKVDCGMWDPKGGAGQIGSTPAPAGGSSTTGGSTNGGATAENGANTGPMGQSTGGKLGVLPITQPQPQGQSQEKSKGRPPLPSPPKTQHQQQAPPPPPPPPPFQNSSAAPPYPQNITKCRRSSRVRRS